MYKDLLVHVDGGEAGERRVRLSVELASWSGARLTGLHVTPPAEVPPRYKPSLVAEVADGISMALAHDASASAAAFRKHAMDRMPEAKWLEAAGGIVEGISSWARYADLVILGQYEWQGPPESHPLPIAHAIVLRCGRPVLVAPAAWDAGRFDRVLVAWDGSREAVRSVHDSLPLLRAAQSVRIARMAGLSADEADADLKSLTAHLGAHGITVETNLQRTTAAEEHRALLDLIESSGCDLLVMGGYSHGRWAEFIFGGATRSILLSSQVPVLVSH